MDKKKLIGIVIGVLIVIIAIFFSIKGCTKPKEYTVSFDSNGGSYVASITIKENKIVTKPTDPTREGYQFVGWYDGEEFFDFNTKVTEDIRLVAKWNADDLKLSVSNMNLEVGKTDSIQIEVLPSGFTAEDFIWESSDKTIASVDQNGNVKALKKGTVTITVKSKDETYSQNVSITVSEKSEAIVEVESITISGANQVTINDTISLTATIKPTNATNKKITWQSSDTKVATVDQNGKVKGLKAGTVTITATTENGKKATVTITVKQKTTSTATPKPNTTPKPTATPKPTQPTPTPTPSQEPTPTPTIPTPEPTIDPTPEPTTEPTPVPTPEPKYVLIFKKHQLDVGSDSLQYDVSVTENGVGIDYKGFKYAGSTYAKGKGWVSSNTIKDRSIKDAEIILTSGQHVPAEVQYIDS